MTPTIILLLVLLFGANIGFKVYVARKRRPMTKKTEKNPYALRQELLRRLNKLNRFEEGGYKGETKKEIAALSKKIQELDEKVVLEEQEHAISSYVPAVESLEQEVNEFSLTLQTRIAEWESVKEEILSNIEFARVFFDQNNFYPTDFTHDTNRLERKRNDLIDEMRKNPLSDPAPFRSYNNDFREKFDLYERLHAQTSDLLVQYDAVKSEFPSTKVNEIHDLKQQIFFSLQNAKLKEAEKTLKTFKREIRKAQKK